MKLEEIFSELGITTTQEPPPFGAVVVDADQLAYSCGWAANEEPLNYCLNTVKNALKKIKDNSNAGRMRVFIRGQGNFREEMQTTVPYKGTRRPDKPKWFKEIYDYLRDHHEAIPAHGYEADDAVAMFLHKHGDNVILSSPDKDLITVPGWHYHPKLEQAFYVNYEQAMRFFWVQVIAGDRVDNIQGLPYVPAAYAEKYELGTKDLKIAEGRAFVIVNSMPLVDLEDAVKELYFAWGEAEGMTDEDVKAYFNEQLDLLWMCREVNEYGSDIFGFEKAQAERSGNVQAEASQEAEEHLPAMQGQDQTGGGSTGS